MSAAKATKPAKRICRLIGCDSAARANGTCYRHRAVPADQMSAPTKQLCSFAGCRNVARNDSTARCHRHPLRAFPAAGRR